MASKTRPCWKRIQAKYYEPATHGQAQRGLNGRRAMGILAILSILSIPITNRDPRPRLLQYRDAVRLSLQCRLAGGSVVEVLDSWPTIEQKPRRDKTGSPAPWHANIDESGTKGTNGTKGTDKGTGRTTRNRDQYGSHPANVSKENQSPPSQGGHILTRSSRVNDPLLRSLRNPYGGSTWTSHPSDTAEETLRSASRKLAPPPRNSPARKEAPYQLLET